jgi:hypothetical protein
MFALLPRAVLLYSGCISCSIRFLLSAFVSLIKWVPCRSMNAGGSQHTGYGGQPYMQQVNFKPGFNAVPLCRCDVLIGPYFQQFPYLNLKLSLGFEWNFSQQHNMWTLMGRMPMPQILDSHHHLRHTGQTIGNNNASSKDATHLVK